MNNETERFEAALDYLVRMARRGVSAKDLGRVSEAATDVRAFVHNKPEQCAPPWHKLPHKGCALG